MTLAERIAGTGDTVCSSFLLVFANARLALVGRRVLVGISGGVGGAAVAGSVVSVE